MADVDSQSCISMIRRAENAYREFAYLIKRQDIARCQCLILIHRVFVVEGSLKSYQSVAVDDPALTDRCFVLVKPA